MSRYLYGRGAKSIVGMLRDRERESEGATREPACSKRSLDIIRIAPQTGDTLVDLSQKIALVNDILAEGGSIAIATDAPVIGLGMLAAERSVTKSLTGAEKAAYEMWKKGDVLPPFDLAKDKVAVPPTHDPADVKSLESQRATLARMYGLLEKQVTKEHVLWFLEEWEELHGLFDTIHSLVKVEKDNANADLNNDLRRAEYDILARLYKDYSHAQKTIEDDFYRTMKELDLHLRILKGRRDAVAPPRPTECSGSSDDTASELATSSTSSATQAGTISETGADDQGVDVQAAKGKRKRSVGQAGRSTRSKQQPIEIKDDGDA